MLDECEEDEKKAGYSTGGQCMGWALKVSHSYS